MRSKVIGSSKSLFNSFIIRLKLSFENLFHLILYSSLNSQNRYKMLNVILKFCYLTFIAKMYIDKIEVKNSKVN